MAEFDFMTYCRPGMVLETRDRRAARITAVAADAGIISGVVQMLGECAWHADGRFHRAPAGAAGPWDLMPPAEKPVGEKPAGEKSAGTRTHARLADALQKADGNPGCCD